jgi:hypothetical protein
METNAKPTSPGSDSMYPYASSNWSSRRMLTNENGDTVSSKSYAHAAPNA